jgi:outer membrane protein insertion porin family
VVLALGLTWAAAARADPPSATIERIDVLGLSRMSRPSLMFLLGVKEGDPYDPVQLRERFRAVWDGGQFEDITFEVEPGTHGGQVLIIKVQERPWLSAVTYDESSIVTRTQIEDRLTERHIQLGVGKPLDMGQVFYAESAIRDLFAERGFLDATAKASVQRATETTRSVHFTLSAGGKTKIRAIRFTGNEVFSDRALKSQLKLTHERKWYWPWSSKNLYHPLKWDQDISGLRNLYKSRGYLDVEIRPPVIDVRPRKPGKKPEPSAPPPEPEPALVAPPQASDAEAPPRSARKAEERARKAREKARKKAGGEQAKRWVYLTVPVHEGEQYRLGQVTLVGSEVIPQAALRAQIPLREGDVINDGLIEAGIDRISRLYEDRGRLYATVLRRTLRRKDQPVADIEITINEDKPYTIDRIEFQGNTATQDKVLRRELKVVEGQLFNRTGLDYSRRLVNQLGYFDVKNEPVIEPLPNTDRVRIIFGGTEEGRNEIQVGGGFSGLEGAFFNGVYSTRNFLGRGQVLSASVQVGGRSNRYQISFQEPWFLGRPWLFGADLFRRETDYGASLNSTASGAGIVVGRRIRSFSRISLGYEYQTVTSQSLVAGSTSATPTNFEATNKLSSVTPLFAFSTINNPYRPTRGTSLTTSLKISGGALGGDTSFVKPQAAMTTYHKAFGRTFLALHGEAGLVREFGHDDPSAATADVEGVPRFQRFWLGGDTLGPRVFETRTITPRRYMRVVDNQIVEVVGDITGLSPEGFIQDVNGIPIPVEVGGDRMYLVQSEFVASLNEQADLAMFLDFGDALFEDTSFDWDTMRASAGVELRFHLPIFPVPLRLIYGWPIRKLEGDRTSSFTFSIGRSF